MNGTRPAKTRRRYVVFHVTSDGEFEYEEVSQSIWDMLLRLFGELGVSLMDLRLMEYDEQSGFGILRCTHKTVDAVHAGVSMISNIEGTPVLIDVKKITGSLRKARKVIGELKKQAT
ncbi:MAG: hypothetical protein KIH01_04025 [Candidatus Freyarchaeota archaeon]|nr:hypothetical protein [Candidatus Jordarchaeia archaeon]